jgi:DNA-binding NtrC family response regulator
MSTPSILIIDDEQVMRDVLTTLLTEEGYKVFSVNSGEEGVDQIKQEMVDLVVLDLMLPGQGGLATLEEILSIDPDIVVIMISAYASIENAVRATKSGAFDFVTKPFNNEELLIIVGNGLKKRSLEIENRQLRQTIQEQPVFENIVGKSDRMQKIFDLISQVAPHRSTVLINGESGTGKELVANAIHNLSPRSEGPFVAVNSSSIPIDLLESELFGHVKGAFTGAISDKKGLFEIASGGTIFLDEVGTLPTDTQVKLLRAIQEREFRRVGGLDNTKVDVRIIAATNSDLKMAVENGQFREDLYYRLNVITIHLPALRERKEDIPILTDHFIHLLCKENERSECFLDPIVLKFFIEYDWPGNVRELENILERAVVLAPKEGQITEDLLPQELIESYSISQEKFTLLENGSSLKDLVSEYERGLIRTALEKTDWNQKKAAHLLSVNATTLNEKMKRLKIKISSV